jgi:mannose-6-phosphate isomerase-like protein (cupin superfamily)
MRLTAIVLVVYGTALASSEAVAVTYSSSPLAKIIATKTLPELRNSHFRIISNTFSSGEIDEISPSDGIYYQYSGKVEMNIGLAHAILDAGDGLFMPAGTKFTLRAVNVKSPSIYLQFLLSPKPESEPDQPTGTSVEVYRSPSPIPGLIREPNFLSLARVSVPPASPFDPLHQRSGAAVHYVVSGVGAELMEGQATAKGPGSFSYEPRGLVYQWGNPGSKALTYLVFNINPPFYHQ